MYLTKCDKCGKVESAGVYNNGEVIEMPEGWYSAAWIIGNKKDDHTSIHATVCSKCALEILEELKKIIKEKDNEV